MSSHLIFKTVKYISPSLIFFFFLTDQETELEFEHRLFNAKARCWLPEASRRWDLSSTLQRLSGSVGVKWDSDTEQAEQAVSAQQTLGKAWKG